MCGVLIIYVSFPFLPAESTEFKQDWKFFTRNTIWKKNSKGGEKEARVGEKSRGGGEEGGKALGAAYIMIFKEMSLIQLHCLVQVHVEDE